MALKVWLPLNGDLKNYGTADISVTNSGATTNSAGKIGSCYAFNNSTLTTSSINIGDDFSVCYWVKYNDLSYPRTHVGINHSLGAYTGTNKGWDIAHGPSGGGTYNFDMNDGTNIQRMSFGSISGLTDLGVWKHFTLTCSLSTRTVKLYIDGTLVGTQSISSSMSSFKVDRAIVIGGLYGWYLNGYLNDVRIYDHCLSLKEISEISQGLVLHYKLSPLEYKRLEYIEGTGTQYLETNYTPNGNTQVDCEIMKIQDDPSYPGGWYYGSRKSNRENQYGYLEQTSLVTTGSWRYGNNMVNFNRMTVLNTKQHIYSDSSLYIDGVLIASANSLTFTSPHNLVIFSMRDDDGISMPNNTEHMRLYYFNISENNHLISSLIPVKRTLDNSIGMYDTLNNIFYSSSSNSSFIAGPEADDTMVGIEMDYSGYHYDGTITGNLFSNNDSPRYSRNTKFTSDSLITSSLQPDINNSSISFGGWFKFNQAEIAAKVMSYTFDANHTYATGNLIGNCNYGGIGLVWTTNNIYSSGVFSSLSVFGNLRTSSINSNNTNAFTVSFDEWTHIFLTYNRDTNILSLYKNGVLINAKTIGVFSDYVLRNFAVNLNWVHAGNGPGMSIPMQASDIRVYMTALTAADILNLYHTAAVVDNHQNLHCFELEEETAAKNRIRKTGVIETGELEEASVNIYLRRYDPIAYDEYGEFTTDSLDYYRYCGEKIVYNNLLCYIWHRIDNGHDYYISKENQYDSDDAERGFLSNSLNLSLPFNSDKQEFVALLYWSDDAYNSILREDERYRSYTLEYDEDEDTYYPVGTYLPTEYQGLCVLELETGITLKKYDPVKYYNTQNLELDNNDYYQYFEETVMYNNQLCYIWHRIDGNVDLYIYKNGDNAEKGFLTNSLNLSLPFDTNSPEFVAILYWDDNSNNYLREDERYRCYAVIGSRIISQMNLPNLCQGLCKLNNNGEYRKDTKIYKKGIITTNELNEI